MINPVLQDGPAVLDLVDTAGDGWAITITVDIDLTGYTVGAAVVNHKSRAVVQVWSTINVTPGATSTIALAMTGAETLPLAGEALDWWLMWTPALGQPDTVITGSVTAKER